MGPFIDFVFEQNFRTMMDANTLLMKLSRLNWNKSSGTISKCICVIRAKAPQLVFV